MGCLARRKEVLGESHPDKVCRMNKLKYNTRMQSPCYRIAWLVHRLLIGVFVLLYLYTQTQQIFKDTAV